LSHGFGFGCTFDGISFALIDGRLHRPADQAVAALARSA
jgi:hypothetical protein